MRYNPEYDYYRVGRAKLYVTDPQDSARRIIESIGRGEKGYVCISNMRTTVYANTTPDYLEVMNGSLFNTPDGTPLVWCGKAWGLKNINRACGPHIFEILLHDKASGLKHFFLGDTDETLARMKLRLDSDYGVDIAGMYSPPFAPLEEYDLDGIAAMINGSGANIVWTSLRAPKQDYLNAMLLPYLNDGIVLVGVGAAFRYLIGELKSPDGFLQKIGLAGLMFKRANSKPWKEFVWYIKHSFYLMKYMVSILFRRMVGIKYYE